MKRVLTGPTTEGSYVISVWVPIPPRLTRDEDLVLFDDYENEPFERAATKHLNRALVAAREATADALNTDADCLGDYACRIAPNPSCGRVRVMITPGEIAAGHHPT